LREVVIGRKGYSLKRFEEAFTSEAWMVRIYKVLKDRNLDDIAMKSKQRKFPSNLNKFMKDALPLFGRYKYGNKIPSII
jgi:hypothetical protein